MQGVKGFSLTLLGWGSRKFVDFSMLCLIGKRLKYRYLSRLTISMWLEIVNLVCYNRKMGFDGCAVMLSWWITSIFGI
jgi:hypothetical protein